MFIKNAVGAGHDPALPWRQEMSGRNKVDINLPLAPHPKWALIKLTVGPMPSQKAVFASPRSHAHMGGGARGTRTCNQWFAIDDDVVVNFVGSRPPSRFARLGAEPWVAGCWVRPFCWKLLAPWPKLKKGVYCLAHLSAPFVLSFGPVLSSLVF